MYCTYVCVYYILCMYIRITVTTTTMFYEYYECTSDNLKSQNIIVCVIKYSFIQLKKELLSRILSQFLYRGIKYNNILHITDVY